MAIGLRSKPVVSMGLSIKRKNPETIPRYGRFKYFDFQIWPSGHPMLISALGPSSLGLQYSVILRSVAVSRRSQIFRKIKSAFNGRIIRREDAPINLNQTFFSKNFTEHHLIFEENKIQFSSAPKISPKALIEVDLLTLDFRARVSASCWKSS